MIFLGSNAAGILNKKESLLRNIQHFMPGAFFIQESKTKRKNKIKIPNYVIFEQIRKESAGGGLITAVHENLEPVSVCDGMSDEEVLVVEAKLKNKIVRLINAYGPQEDTPEEKKNSFFHKLDEEVKRAKVTGAMICMELDANSKLGPMIISGDPHPQSKNGKLLEDLVNDNDLVVVNGLDICQGKITRFRKTIKRTEKSIIDFFIVCKSFLTLITQMTVDEEGVYSLTKFSTKKGVKSIKKSDHNLLILELDLKWSSMIKSPRIEIFNFKNEEDLKSFQCETEECEELLECFKKFENLNDACSKWLKILNDIIRKSFRKIRISKSKLPPELEILFKKKESLKQKIHEEDAADNIDGVMELEDRLEEVIEEISAICCQRNRDIVKEYVGNKDEFGDDPHNQLKTWRLKKKLAPKHAEEAPTAKINSEGELVTEKDKLEELYLKTYIERLKPNETQEDLKDIKELKNLLFGLRLNISGKIISPEWTMADLEKVLKELKNGKARDAHGHIYELFKYGGRHLKLSLLRMFNLTKNLQIYPSIFQPSNISSIYKQRGMKNDLNSDRGVFNVVKVRSILDRLTYNDNYEIIDQSMSCSNIGARKNRNIRDHLFIVNGILNEVRNLKNKQIDIQIVDIKKCFDKMSYKETANDLYNAGVKNDHFVLMANSNKKCQVAVRTPWGSVTKRVELKEIEMQGTVPAPLKCSIQIDTLGKECIEKGECLYKYKECVDIPPLAMIDDIIAFSDCSVESVKLNALIKSKVAHKNLELGPDKCFKMHVGKESESCPTLTIDEEVMLSSSREKYLGDILTTDCRIDQNIEERYKKGIGIVNTISGMLKEISFGYYYFEMAVMFRQSMLLSGILCNSEVLYGMNKSHVEKLESIDRYFWRKIFQCPFSTPIETFYMETNTVSIKYVLMSRRLMFYWNILQMDEHELVKRVFIAQKISTSKNDWVIQIEDDLKLCKILQSAEEI